jgi:UDP-glucuronate 4-epimerase
MRRYKILVTGGAGFIGSHLAEALLHDGQEVVIVDNLDDFYSPERKRANLSEIAQAGALSFHEIDIRDRSALESVLEVERPEVIVHLAARAGVRPSFEQPEVYGEVNVGGTLNLLMLATRFNIRKFVFASSSSVYGADASIPFTEENVGMKPLSPYAATKLAGELLCYTYSHIYGLPVICLRFFTVYGPRQRPDLAISKFTALLETGRKIPIFGDGSSSRDYTHVDDIVAGVRSAMEYESRFEVFNLGNSQPVRLLDLVRLQEQATGKKAILEYLPDQPGDMPRTCADISKARRLLGYAPRVPFRSGLEQFVEWFRRANRPLQTSEESCAPPAEASSRH